MSYVPLGKVAKGSMIEKQIASPLSLIQAQKISEALNYLFAILLCRILWLAFFPASAMGYFC